MGDHGKAPFAQPLPACPWMWLWCLCPGQPLSPRQALPADCIGRGCAVGLLQAIDEGTGQAGLAAVVSPAVLELPGRAGHALRVPAAAVAAVLQSTSWWWGHSCGEGTPWFQMVLRESVPSLGAKRGRATVHVVSSEPS